MKEYQSNINISRCRNMIGVEVWECSNICEQNRYK